MDNNVDVETQSHAVQVLNENICQLEDCWEVVKIEKVTAQIVAGMKYVITGVFEELLEGKRYELSISIWEKRWENFVGLTLAHKKAI